MDRVLLSILLLALVPRFRCQSLSNRYRNRYIVFSVQRLCFTTGCGAFGQVCDVATYPCDAPSCPKYPMCFQTNGNIEKSGICPRPWNILSNDVPCSSDWACTGSMICCHGFFGSACVSGATPALP